MLQIKDFKLKNEIKYSGFGLEISFEPSAEMYEKHEKNQQEQMQIMLEKLDLSKLNIKEKATTQDILQNFDKLNTQEIMEISEKYGKNQSEELVFLIPDLKKDDIKKHFSQISNNDFKNNMAYKKFIDDLSGLIIQNMLDFQEVNEGK